MILLAYIIIGHREWRGSEIKIFAIYPEGNIEVERNKLYELIEQGQLPISYKNIEFITRKTDVPTEQIISTKSQDADLTVLGFRPELIKHDGVNAFQEYVNLGNILFVNAAEHKAIK